ncbi:hypothetical protein GHSM17_43 [Vibrio phage vB_VpaP_GHSM17]|uniref:Uncharacterized protein n=1 Tax=Vibrio phage vB_VpaP_GHSM17 TaxID=2911515 RepID=A0AAE9HAB5_9CAUD|nr:hypothetical protein GHSM17_43 [Vibrio phage vB_VpaP_GHSM17]
MSKSKQRINRYTERFMFIAVLVIMVAAVVAIGWGFKALELMFYKWALGF